MKFFFAIAFTLLRTRVVPVLSAFAAVLFVTFSSLFFVVAIFYFD
jgi:hypothetical protein